MAWGWLRRDECQHRRQQHSWPHHAFGSLVFRENEQLLVAGAGDGALFQYEEAARQWRRRDRCKMKVNVGASGTARLIMPLAV